MFTATKSKKNNNQDQKQNQSNTILSPSKYSLETYRNLQKSVRIAKNEVSSAEGALKKYENELVSSFETVQDFEIGPFTIIELAFQGYSGVGISRRSEADERNEKLGKSIALGRAQRVLLSKINKDSNTQREVLAG